MPQFEFRIIKTEPSLARQRQLVKALERDRNARSVVKEAIVEAITSDPELRQRVEQVAQRRRAAACRRHLERPMERGGDRPALLVEHAYGSSKRIDRGAGDPRKLEKSKRASFRDVFCGERR
jgi:hypothetical protein